MKIFIVFKVCFREFVKLSVLFVLCVLKKICVEEVLKWVELLKFFWRDCIIVWLVIFSVV